MVLVTRMNVYGEKTALNDNCTRCGWGGTARNIAENYRAEVVGVTVFEELANLTRRKVKGLPEGARQF